MPAKVDRAGTALSPGTGCAAASAAGNTAADSLFTRQGIRDRDDKEEDEKASW